MKRDLSITWMMKAILAALVILSFVETVAIGVVISGYTTETWGEGVEGVLVSADNNGGSDTSNGDGYYELVVTLGWSGTVTPSKVNRTFEPPNQSYTNLNTDISGQDFVAERIWAYGSGTAEDPYLIYTPEDMNNIGANPDSWDKHFKLMADIDLVSYTGAAFNTIGISPQQSFTGVFDGNGKTISNFNYNSTGTNSVGLFGIVGTYSPVAEKGEIRNLGLINPDVNAPGGSGVGALVGGLLGTITNCYTEGANVSGSSDVGGLVGFGEGDIINCHASGNVDGDNSVGGLIGYFYFEILPLQFKIMNCYSTGIVSGNERVGGLMGVNQREVVYCCSSSSVSGTTDVGGLVGRTFWHGKISNCYSRGDVLGGDGVGGLVGRNQKEINHCYSSGSVSGTTNVGGLVGIHEHTFYYTESFWDNTVNPLLTGIGNGADPDVIGESTTNMKKESTFASAGWDFVGETINGPNDIWTILEGKDYPRLSWEQRERVKRRNISLVKNGSFESDGAISDITVKAPRRWCDVNLPAGKFGGWISSDWNTKGDYSLSLYSYIFVEFTAGDMATVSQQVYLTDVDQIIFDLRLGYIGGDIWDPVKRSALILIDEEVIWDSSDWTPDARGEYRNQTVDVNEVYKDASPHTLSLAIRANVSETEWFYEYLAQWDFVKFDAYCGGFGYLPEDLNLDCYVDTLDLKLLAEQWLAKKINDEYDLFRDDEFIINFPDFAMFASYWQANNCQPIDWCGGSDFNRSGTVDFADLLIFAERWLGQVTFLLSDFSEDDVVNFEDYTVLANRWQDNTDWINWQDENCFELGLPAADLNYDGIVNLRDFAILIGDLGSEGPCLISDIDGSEVVDYGDFSKLVDGWLLTSWLYGLK